MGEKQWLSLDRAAAASGIERRALRELLRSGRLPAVRRKGRWRVARRDLAPLAALTSLERLAGASALGTAPSAERDGSPSLATVLAERDAAIRRLEEDRLQMARLIGFLQAQVHERDARLALFEASAAAHPPAHAGRTNGPPHLGVAAGPQAAIGAGDEDAHADPARASRRATGRPRLLPALLRLLTGRR